MPLEKGETVYALYPGDGHYYEATVEALTAPRLCSVYVDDETFSDEMPTENIIVSSFCYLCFALESCMLELGGNAT